MPPSVLLALVLLRAIERTEAHLDRLARRIGRSL